MFRNKLNQAIFLGFLVLMASSFTACKQQPPPMPKIDLTQVGEAFQQSTGATATAWLWDFEWRVNQIYPGKEFVRIDARRYRGKLRIIGYIDRNKRFGYQLSDELIFQLRQYTGAFKFGYKVYDHIGWAGYTKSYNKAPSFGFFPVLVVSPFRYYYTPRTRLVIYRKRRRAYRKTKKYRARRARAKKFRARAKKAGKSRSKARRRSSRRRGGKR